MNDLTKNFSSRHKLPSILIALLLSLFCFLTAAAQEPIESRVKTGLQELHDAIAKAREILAAFENREARDFLMKAEAAAKEAEAKYQRALTMNDKRLRDALLKEALANVALGKTYVERALKSAFEIPLARLRNRLAELMPRAEQIVLSQSNREAQRLVYQARKTQLDAERAAPRDPRRASELYQVAIALVEKAINLVQGRKPAPDTAPETILNRERERYEQLEKRTRETVENPAGAGGKNTAAQLVFEQAQKQARTAQEAFRKGETALAQQLYHGATRLLLRAIDLAMAGRKSQDFGRHEVTLLQDLIQTAEQESKENADPRASLFLERARVLVREAETALDQQQMQEAKWRLELARNFVDKAMRKADRGAVNAGNLAQRYNEALQELARDLEEVGTKAREANKPEAAQLVELATNAYKAAETAGRQNRLVIGFQLIRMAQHLLLRAETMLRESPPSSEIHTREAFLQRWAQIENRAQEIAAAGELDACQTVQAQALDMLQRSRAALDRGQIRLAVAIMEVANDLIENCARR
ncbi:MAG: hypothetical protein ONB41_11940 [candidate division KSB1 bacterium]|nr:hypothetical protein [candidate division KSB1 bacterium]